MMEFTIPAGVAPYARIRVGVCGGTLLDGQERRSGMSARRSTRRLGQGAKGCAVLVVPMLLFCLSLAGCTGPSQYAAGVVGKSSSYRPGQPVFDIEVSPTLADSGAAMEVYLSILRSSLTFFRTGGRYVSAYSISVRLLDPESDMMVVERMWPDTVSVATYAETQANISIRVARSLDVQPGRYIVLVGVEDHQTQKIGSRYQILTLHAGRGDAPSLGRTLMYWSAEYASRQPITSFHIPGRADSLVAAVESFHLPVGSSMMVAFVLIRYVIDSTMATPPFYYYGSGGMQMSGRRLYPERADTVFRKRTVIVPDSARQKLTVVLPVLPRGIYCVMVTIVPLSATKEDLENAACERRYFALMPGGFPKPVALPEMVEMLGYLATEKEKRDFDTTQSAIDLRAKFEAFWLQSVRDREVAASVIRKYYSRIEEANRLFSTFKEGWKTDRGMIYIVLGPPEYVESRFDTELWYYSYSGSAQEGIMQFHRAFFAPEGLSVEDFSLYRSTMYEAFWDRRVQKWREGEVF